MLRIATKMSKSESASRHVHYRDFRARCPRIRRAGWRGEASRLLGWGCGGRGGLASFGAAAWLRFVIRLRFLRKYHRNRRDGYPALQGWGGVAPPSERRKRMGYATVSRRGGPGMNRNRMKHAISLPCGSVCNPSPLADRGSGDSGGIPGVVCPATGSRLSCLQTTGLTTDLG